MGFYYYGVLCSVFRFVRALMADSGNNVGDLVYHAKPALSCDIRKTR